LGITMPLGRPSMSDENNVAAEGEM
jgi:hypothetical protein